jgi:hypothetical protein
MTKKTVAQILNTCNLGDVLVAGQRSWKVSSLDFDGAIVAKPLTSPKGFDVFELWSIGPESIAVITGLMRAPTASDAKRVKLKAADPKNLAGVVSQIKTMSTLGFGNVAFPFKKEPKKIIKALSDLGFHVYVEPRDTYNLVHVEW